MKINTIIQQTRRDFRAEYICEHCGHSEVSSGYDDDHFHTNVIPKMVCKRCGKKADKGYRALTTKYPDGVQI